MLEKNPKEVIIYFDDGQKFTLKTESRGSTALGEFVNSFRMRSGEGIFTLGFGPSKEGRLHIQKSKISIITEKYLEVENIHEVIKEELAGEPLALEISKPDNSEAKALETLIELLETLAMRAAQVNINTEAINATN
jgi:hypothetical protein